MRENNQWHNKTNNFAYNSVNKNMVNFLWNWKSLFPVDNKKSCGEGILYLSGLDLWKNIPRSPLYQSVATNPPTGSSNMGVSEGLLENPWTILYLALVDWNLEIIDYLQKKLCWGNIFLGWFGSLKEYHEGYTLSECGNQSDHWTFNPGSFWIPIGWYLKYFVLITGGLEPWNNGLFTIEKKLCWKHIVLGWSGSPE